jgi:hypothetical protein
MRGPVPFLLVVLAAVVGTTAIANAAPEKCHGRVVNKPTGPVPPGCRLGTCNEIYSVAQDDKGPYCIRIMGCHAICPPKPVPKP